MKKLMIAAAIVCAAAFANAATVTWSVGIITDAPEAGGWGEGTAGAGYTATLSLYSDSGMSAASLIWSGSATAWEDGCVFGETADAFSYNPATTYYGKVICTTSVNGELQTLESQGFEFTTRIMEPYPSISIGTDPELISGSIQKIGGAEFTATDTYGAFTASGWTAAPEPTSGLLLLIGVGALALRRKRA